MGPTQIAEQYRRSGSITREIRRQVPDYVRPGTKYVEICRRVEEGIRALGGAPAFPTGIGVNQVTAHYSPQTGDPSVVREGDLVKVDFGVHVEGYVTDTAVSVALDPEHALLVEAAERALDAAIEMARREARIGEIGRAIHAEAQKRGLKTIENLTGHTLDRFTVHAGKSIPNVYVPGLPSLKPGDVFAIEPFVTVGSAAGYVVDSPSVTIFALTARKRTGRKEPDRLAETVWNERKTLPFTPRWYEKEWGEVDLREMVGELTSKRVLHAYPTLVEASGKPVAQFEHTMALTDKGLEILT